jgi:hypothetical protein
MSLLFSWGIFYAAIIGYATPAHATDVTSFRTALREHDQKARQISNGNEFLYFTRAFYNPDGTPMEVRQILRSSQMTGKIQKTFDAFYAAAVKRIWFADGDLKSFKDDFNGRNLPDGILRRIERIYENSEVFVRHRGIMTHLQIGSRRQKAAAGEMIEALAFNCHKNFANCVARLSAGLNSHRSWLELLTHDSAHRLFEMINAALIEIPSTWPTSRRSKDLVQVRRALLSRFLRRGHQACADLLIEPAPES